MTRQPPARPLPEATGLGLCFDHAPRRAGCRHRAEAPAPARDRASDKPDFAAAWRLLYEERPGY